MPRIIRVLVHARSHEERVEEVDIDQYEAWVTSAPTGGEANEDLIQALAIHLNIPISTIRIKSGGKSRHKLIEIA